MAYRDRERKESLNDRFYDDGDYYDGVSNSEFLVYYSIIKLVISQPAIGS